ncbi:MAG: SDR family oxidoreductase [Terriglobales bacterium]
MRIFITGATGFIGSALVGELIGAGHNVIGLARSERGAQWLAAAGAEVQRGELEDLDSLRRGAAPADAVIHAAFIHDFSRYRESAAIDRKAIEALGAALCGSERRLIVTAGLPLAAAGRLATEADAPGAASATFPRASEQTAAALEAQGVRAIVMRLPQVHDTSKQGLVSYSIQIAREKGVSAYVGEGCNRWPAVHRLDAARLYRLALEKGAPGARYHAVAEEGVTARDIAEAIGRGLGVPVRSIPAAEAANHFGWLGAFIGLDLPASSAQTRAALNWTPNGSGLIADLNAMRY